MLKQFREWWYWSVSFEGRVRRCDRMTYDIVMDKIRQHPQYVTDLMLSGELLECHNQALRDLCPSGWNDLWLRNVPEKWRFPTGTP